MHKLCIEALKSAMEDLNHATQILEPMQDDDFCFIWETRIKGLKDDLEMAIEGAEKELSERL